jgi:hypothetical protein
VLDVERHRQRERELGASRYRRGTIAGTVPGRDVLYETYQLAAHALGGGDGPRPLLVALCCVVHHRHAPRGVLCSPWSRMSWKYLHSKA